ncbi:hypothetical protein BJX70DRAFT_205393 [Aspergillus crustosus]
MNYPHGSCSSAPAIPPSSSSDVAPQGHSAYSNTAHNTTTYSFQTVGAGLGISYGQDAPIDDLRPYPSESYATAWPSQWMTQTIPYGSTLNTNNQIPPATFYEHYSGSDASTSPVSYCGPQSMSASSSRGSALDFRTGPDVMSTHAYNFWPNTPRSDAEVRIKEEPDTEYQDRPWLACAHPASVPLSAPAVQHNTNGYLPKLEGPEEDDLGGDDLHENDCNSSVETSDIPAEVISTWIGEVSSSSDYEQYKIPFASGLQCTLCGARFTRRSNCREHMKRHDPNGRKPFPCDECGKVLGRKTDLKRHIDSVHRGIRKYGCDQCGTRFSRHDTLARHLTDGCKRTGGKSSRPRTAADTVAPNHAQVLPKGGS